MKTLAAAEGLPLEQRTKMKEYRIGLCLKRSYINAPKTRTPVQLPSFRELGGPQAVYERYKCSLCEIALIMVNYYTVQMLYSIPCAICMYTCIYIYIYIYVHMLTYTRTYTTCTRTNGVHVHIHLYMTCAFRTHT